MGANFLDIVLGSSVALESGKRRLRTAARRSRRMSEQRQRMRDIGSDAGEADSLSRKTNRLRKNPIELSF
jgi:hypothetical protein